MRELWKSSLKHPLKSSALILFAGVPFLLGWAHEGRIIADCSIPLIEHVKVEYHEWLETIAKVRRAVESDSHDRKQVR